MSSTPSLKRKHGAPVVTYSRKVATKVTRGQPDGNNIVEKSKVKDETNSSFWDFLDSSDEDTGPKKVTAKSSVAVNETVVKGKAMDGALEIVGKKAIAERRQSVQFTTGHVETTKEPVKSMKAELKEVESAKHITPKKSTLISRSNLKSATPSPSKPAPPRHRAPSTPPLPPKTKPIPPSTTPPKQSPQRVKTTPNRTFPSVKSSPLSTPPHSHKSYSQPISPSPRSASRISTRSRTYSDFSSPRITPKQEKTWDALPLSDEFSPSRRRLVDKLREQVQSSPETSRPPPPVHSFSQPESLPNLDDEISRILEYTVPVVEEPRPSRKELSQSESQGTYLSRSRSFLADSQATVFDELWQPEEPPKIDEELEEDISAVKSWHELRRGGQDKRLLDEMEDLIEECKVGGRIGLRRSSVLQIVQKLVGDLNWRRKFKSLGLMSTFVLTVKDAVNDPILLFCTLLAIELVTKPLPPTIATEVLDLCLAGLKESRDIATLSSLRSIGLPKIMKNEFSALQDQLLKSQIVPEILSSHNIALDIIEELSVSNIHPLCKFLSDSDEQLDWRTLVPISSSLEKGMQGKVMNDLKSQDVDVFNSILCRGINEFDDDPVARKATLTFLRVCINLTNSSSANCDYLNKDDSLISLLTNIITADPRRYAEAYYRNEAQSDDDNSSTEEHELRESKFELVLLSLGLMINFVQESQNLKNLVLSTSSATNIKNTFEKLISRDEPANHAFGYLALLLAHLIIPSSQGHAITVKPETKRNVERLLDDFAGIHRVVQSQSQEEGERKELEGMAGEVENVLRSLRSM